MIKIGIVIPWFGEFRNDFIFWLKSVEFNSTIDFLLFTDQKVIAAIPENLKVIKATLSEMESFARTNVWEGCIISKPYKLCDYKVAYGEMFHNYLENYDFWGHCDMDMIFGNIRKFITNEILSKYDRIGTNGFLTLYRNTPEVNTIYRKVDDIHRIFTEQKPFGFDEFGLNQNGTSSYWIKYLPDRLWNEGVYDSLVPYHYSFISVTLKNAGFDVKNLMYSYINGKLLCYWTEKGEVVCKERLYVHIQKRPIIIETNCTSRYSIVPPGRFIPFVEKVSFPYMKFHIKDSNFWAYYVRARNKINDLFRKEPYSNMILFPKDDYFNGVFQKPFYHKFLKLFKTKE